jgi:type II secretory pathway pseudopilin PulG
MVLATRIIGTGRNGHGRGVTIIEALVALVVLSFGLYSAAELVTASRRNGQMASWRAEAAGLAALKVEELRLAAPRIREMTVGRPATEPLVFPTTREERIFPQNKRLSWTATVTRPTDDPARLDIQVEVFRTAKSDLDIPVIASGMAFLPNWPDAPVGGLQ